MNFGIFFLRFPINPGKKRVTGKRLDFCTILK